MRQSGPVEWLLSYYWAAALGAAHRLHDVVGWLGRPPGEPTADGCAEPTDLDLELIRVVRGLGGTVNCAVCGARLDGAVNVDVTGGFSRLPGSS